MKRIWIPAKRKYAIVDKEDYKKCFSTTWQINPSGYVFNARHESIFLARHILNLKKGDGKIVDHINGNKLDNRKSNLRICNTSKNGGNRKINKNNKTGLKGVHVFRGRYKAVIKHEGRRYYLGSYATKKEAGEAYDLAAIKYFKQYAKTNYDRSNYA